jgi:hypothetical protein
MIDFSFEKTQKLSVQLTLGETALTLQHLNEI